MRWVKRIIILLATVVLLTIVVPVIGLQLWLANQSPRVQATTKASLGSFTAAQQLVLISDFFFPRELSDHGSFGRRETTGRGHVPWAFRTSLDRRPRILNLALAPEVWLAYSTETATIYQFWRGGVDLAGAVYDAQHGSEPRSVGNQWIPPSDNFWQILSEEGWQPANIRWESWGIDQATARAWIRFRLSDASGRSVVLWESPEVRGADDPSITLERRFRRLTAGGPSVRIALPPAAEQTSIDGMESPAPAFLELPALADRASGPTIEIRQSFSGPSARIESVSSDVSLPSSPLLRHGCQSCHHEKEQIVGPSWRAIATRYAEDPRDRSVVLDTLARRIIEGGGGSWGKSPCSPIRNYPRSKHARWLKKSSPTANRAKSRSRANGPSASPPSHVPKACILRYR